MQASRAIECGDASVVLVGGVESMSRAPWVVGKPEHGLPRGAQTMHDTTLGWRFVNPRMAELGVSTESMGETGENVAERYGIGREDQDAFGLRSHQRAVAAAEKGIFAEEIVPIEAPKGRRETVTVDTDEGPRADASLEKMAKLRPAFREGGTVTAGNASTLNDGAACTLIASEAGAKELGAEPLARIVAFGVAGVDPAYMGIGPALAIPRALDAAGLTLDEIDLIELNEAFASQVLACVRELGIEEDRLNVNGGAIALGHPLGCTGARLTTTLTRELRRRGGRYGIATMCVGVGQGLATIFEAV
jgi:acetyl-CoA acetyltransferase family protein